MSRIVFLPRIRTAGSVVVALCTLAGGAPALPDTDAFFLPDDLEVTLWASSPMFFNPTNIDVDARGRVWVTEAVNYRDFNNKHLPLRDAGDRVVILEDTDGDGRADASRVFVQDPDLRAPLGVAVVGDKVIVSSAPSMIVYTDADGDDQPDHKEVFLTGFGGFDHDHSLHALVAGPDGQWYFNAGNAGPHLVTDKAGWTLRSGSAYRGGTPYNHDNRPGLLSDDGRLWVGGLGLRIRPDGTGLTVLGHNFRNAYELAIDSFGDLWQNDNDDEIMGCRTTWLMEGANTGYFSADGTRFWAADRRPGQDVFTAQWHQEDPGVLPAGDRVGAGSPTGIVRYEGDALGPAYRGLVFSADAGRNIVFAYRPSPQGAGYHLERSTLITSVEESTQGYVWDDRAFQTDQRKWFRPSDVAVGPDGAVYIADWYDAVVGGHRADDETAAGRIYRITPKGKRLPTPRFDLRTTAGQLDALRSPAVNVRHLGFEALRARGPAVLDDVRGLLDDANPFVQARAVWLLAALGTPGVEAVESLLQHDDADLRVAALRALRGTGAGVLPYARMLVRDPSPAVRREVAVALRDVPLAESQDLLLALAEGYDGADRWYLEAFGLAAEGKEAALYPLLKTALGGPDPVAWSDRFAGLAWRLHPAEAVEDLARRAAAPALSPAQRKQAIVALGFIKDPGAAGAMVALSRSDLPDVAAQATWWLLYRKTNDWRAFNLAGWQPPEPSFSADDLDRMHALLGTAQDRSLWIAQRMEAALEVAGHPLGARLLLALRADGTWIQAFGGSGGGWQIDDAIRKTLSKNPDPMVQAFARTHTFSAPPRDEAMTPARLASRAADAGRGQMLFAVHCASCHRVGTLGGEVGPDLTQIHTQFGREGLLDAILNPEAAVAHSFTPWLVTTREGVATYGFVLSEAEAVVMRDAAGRQVVLEADQIVARIPLEGSLMPRPEALGLEAQDVVDLAAFLMTAH